jgi:hypothetical protein
VCGDQLLESVGRWTTARIGRSRQNAPERRGRVCEPYPQCKPSGGALLRTSDGGRHWQLVRLPRALGVNGIDFVNPRIGFVNDQFAGFYRTRDGGRSWRAVPATS